MRLLLREPEADSKRSNLREYAAGIRFRVTGSRFEQALVHWQQARALWPSQLSPDGCVSIRLRW